MRISQVMCHSKQIQSYILKTHLQHHAPTRMYNWQIIKGWARGLPSTPEVRWPQRWAWALISCEQSSLTDSLGGSKHSLRRWRWGEGGLESTPRRSYLISLPCFSPYPPPIGLWEGVMASEPSFSLPTFPLLYLIIVHCLHLTPSPTPLLPSSPTCE